MNRIVTIFFLVLFCFIETNYSQNLVTIKKQRLSGIVFLGKEKKIYIQDSLNFISKQKIKILSNKNLTKILKSSKVFFEPTYVRNAIHFSKLDTTICGNYIDVVGEKYVEKETIKLKKNTIEYIFFDEEIFEVKIFKDGKLTDTGFTFEFCTLKEKIAK